MEWAAALPDEEYPEPSYLGEFGEVFPHDTLARLEADLRRALGEKPGDPQPDVLSVGRPLLEIVAGRPRGAQAMVVTDGTQDDEGEEDSGG